MAKKWIQRAIKRPGRVRRAAKRAGMSVARYCSPSRPGYKRLSTSMKRACALARRLRRMPKRGRRK